MISLFNRKVHTEELATRVATWIDDNQIIPKSINVIKEDEDYVWYVFY